MRRLAVLLLALSGGGCASVLGLEPPGVRPFEHRAHVLNGVSCVQCHTEVRSAGEDDPIDIPDTARCLECHQTPHDTRDCSQCHGKESTRERAEDARRFMRFEHRVHVPGLGGQCVRCHVEVAKDDSPLLPPMAACLGCHDHEGQFADRRCESCHTDLEDEAVRPASHQAHEAGFVKSHGPRAAASRDLCLSCHTERSCLSCHGKTTPALPERLAFDRTEETGIHRAGFRSRHALEAAGQPGLCLTCHSETSCRDCHSSSGVAAGKDLVRSPHPFGWVGSGNAAGHGPAARRDPLMCASCHGGAGEALCVGCHRVGGPGGDIHPPGFKSNKSKTREAPCVGCHG